MIQNPGLKGHTRGIVPLILGGADVAVSTRDPTVEYTRRAAGKIKLQTQCDDVQYNRTPHLI